ncbi:MAG: S1C family serine protease [Candidatus Limnocylindrales bacterium]
MNERPTEPYDPADQAASTPATPATPPAAPTPVTPARISTTGDPTAEPTAPVWPEAVAQPPVEPAAFSPEPDRTNRDRVAWQTPVQSTPESWFEPAASAATTIVPRATERRRTSGVLGPVLAASVIAATLASGGTYLTLRASGALDQVAGTATVPSGQTASAPQPVKIDESSAIIDVAARVSPAVVKIVSTTDPTNVDPTAAEGIGSGIIYDKNGWILTNRHVVSGGGKLTVELKDGRRFDGTIYGIDTLTDLAIVKVATTDLPAAAIGDSSTLKVGQTTIAIGSPLGTYSSTVTSGILSATGRSIEVDSGRINNLLQTDTAINPGNSGGPLLDAGGNVIGINTAIAANANGIGFAIPINIARPIMEQAVAGQKLARPYVGICYEMLDLQRATELKLSVHAGAYISECTDANGQPTPAIKAGGPADKAGIKDGDIIVAIEGQAIDTEHPLDSVLTQFAPGRTVTVGLLRNGQNVEVMVTLGVRPADL